MDMEKREKGEIVVVEEEEELESDVMEFGICRCSATLLGRVQANRAKVVGPAVRARWACSHWRKANCPAELGPCGSCPIPWWTKAAELVARHGVKRQAMALVEGGRRERKEEASRNLTSARLIAPG
ncbi:hypothetical protein Drorol1_Dr00020517 [Drosera rotundifolia]